MDTFSFIVSILLAGFVITDIAAAYLLLNTSARADYSIIALNERAMVATVQSVSGVILGILGGNRIFGLGFPVELTLVMLSLAVMLQAVPAIVWLLLYFNKRFTQPSNRKE